MRLSIELIDHILSFLQSDPGSLEACHKSHPLLSQLAERHRFAHLVLEDFAIHEITKIIHHRPHMATYVRSIEIRVTNYSQELSSILPMMTSLKKVKLDGRRQWQGIPEHFHQAFLDCIHLSSMEDVSIAPLGFPLSALHNVKKLALFHWRQGDYTPDTIELDDGVAHKFNQLESLSLTDFERDPLQKVVALIPPCTLRSLSISVGRYYFRDIFPYEELASLFANCSNSLTNLELNPRWQYNSHSFFMGNERSSESRGQNFQFTLSTLIYLERITFLTKVSISVTHTRGGRASWRFSSPIPIIEHVMKTISSQRLKLLKLDFYFNINSLDPPPNVIWSSLVHLVAESPFPCTKLHVRVGFQELVGYQDIAPDIILNSLAESAELMSYVNRGVLVITSNPVTNKQGAPTVGPLL